MRDRPEAGVVTLEAALGVGVVLALVLLLVQVLALGRDVLVVQDAARAGARAAAAHAGSERVVRAAREAAEGLAVVVTVTPPRRRAGDLAVVEVATTVAVGPLRPQVRARAVARVEPGVGP